MNQTSIARLTPPGRSAVATILVHGEIQIVDRGFQAVNGLAMTSQPLNRIRLGVWNAAGQPAEEIVACRTADNQVELHCHGGEAAVQRILNNLADWGAGSADPWLLRSSESTPFEQEGFRAVTQTTTERTALLALEQWHRLAAAIEQLQTTSREMQKSLIAGMLRWSEFGLHLTKPWQVALCGLPNVGKSSLMNRLLGFNRSVVFDQPGTTRDLLSALTALDGWPVELLDTAGQRDVPDPIETEGVRRARQAMHTADLVILVIDATQPGNFAQRQLLESLPKALVVLNKCDLLTPRPSEVHTTAVSVSAKTGAGISELMQKIIGRLIPEIPPAEAIFPVTDMQQCWLKEMLADLP